MDNDEYLMTHAEAYREARHELPPSEFPPDTPVIIMRKLSAIDDIRAAVLRIEDLLTRLVERERRGLP